MPASVTTVLCSCSQPAPQMQLIEGKRYAKPTPPELDLVMTEEDCGPEEPAPSDSADGGNRPKREKKPQGPRSELPAVGEASEKAEVESTDVESRDVKPDDAMKDLPPET
ncbi:hypothetical protein [Planctomicrobium sp. SH527]|uniref:hypothetical protein n=1 Tax=Planctomicrobium sp. SH527 TaxID=3448123 RepID=UPI003F5CA75F